MGVITKCLILKTSKKGKRRKKMFDLRGKTALVVGGNKGIG